MISMERISPGAPTMARISSSNPQLSMLSPSSNTLSPGLARSHPLSLSALQASAFLHHLHLGSSDPARLAAFYANALEMTLQQQAGGAYMLRGPARRLLMSQQLNPIVNPTASLRL
jgi:hypothetical protein